MEVNTVEELMHHFFKTLSVLNNAVILSNATVDESYLEVKDCLLELLEGVKLVLRSMHRDVDIAKEQLKGLEDMKTKCHGLLQHMQFVLTNMPLKLCTKKHSQNQQAPNVISCEMSRRLKPEIHQNTRGCSYLDFLTVDEFEAVPKYMKGRLTYDKVNRIIEQVDKVFSEKYKLLKLKTASLNELNRKRVEAFRLQENKDTEGIPFIVEKDIAEISSLKVDSSIRNILTILRHYNMLHEIRGGGFVRFAIQSRS